MGSSSSTGDDTDFPPSPPSLLLTRQPDGLYAIRSDLRLHFYVSQLPCGEAAMVPIRSVTGSLARKKNKSNGSDAADAGAAVDDFNRTGAKAVCAHEDDPKGKGDAFHRRGILRFKPGRSDLPPARRTLSISCSDKLCRWNSIGWQGALPSLFLAHSIHMASLTIGGELFDEVVVVEALVRRGGGHGGQMIRVQRTCVEYERSQAAMERALHGDVATSGLSIVWRAPLPHQGGSPVSEVVIGAEGTLQGSRKKGPKDGSHLVSSLSKASMARAARSLMHQQPTDASPAPCHQDKRRRLNPPSPSPSPVTYIALKDQAPDYQRAKQAFTQQQGAPFASWVRKSALTADHPIVRGLGRFWEATRGGGGGDECCVGEIVGRVDAFEVD
ncbi:unnamed protein product [Vitrella brassicaformis CCMP3155]|uniref:tRNA-specific adenosine deaminase 1 n=1 Tax=Vitrella brassicaformis (strain CCMP3155) TaxID=1169540 RepID=A0A0G4G972_VITBC|nr:unnamed protein product [Vitrella brassicaformis CCMP3155]|eukprot:CEM25336.1 unnamed protein product [Vitrella brassicaformis CCMP3155]